MGSVSRSLRRAGIRNQIKEYNTAAETKKKPTIKKESRALSHIWKHEVKAKGVKN